MALIHVAAAAAVLGVALPLVSVARPVPRVPNNARQKASPAVYLPKALPYDFDQKMVIIVPPHADDKMIFVPSDSVDYK